MAIVKAFLIQFKVIATCSSHASKYWVAFTATDEEDIDNKIVVKFTFMGFKPAVTGKFLHF